MKALGSLVIAIVVGLLAIWLFFKLLIGALKLVGMLIAIALAVGVFMVAQKLIGKGR